MILGYESEKAGKGEMSVFAEETDRFPSFGAYKEHVRKELGDGFANILIMWFYEFKNKKEFDQAQEHPAFKGVQEVQTAAAPELFFGTQSPLGEQEETLDSGK